MKFCNKTARERGSAVLIVLALIAVICSLTISNNVALAHLQKELRLIERQQMIAGGTTNAPPAAPK